MISFSSLVLLFWKSRIPNWKRLQYSLHCPWMKSPWRRWPTWVRPCCPVRRAGCGAYWTTGSGRPGWAAWRCPAGCGSGCCRWCAALSGEWASTTCCSDSSPALSPHTHTLFRTSHSDFYWKLMWILISSCFVVGAGFHWHTLTTVIQDFDCHLLFNMKKLQQKSSVNHSLDQPEGV